MKIRLMTKKSFENDIKNWQIEAIKKIEGMRAKATRYKINETLLLDTKINTMRIHNFIYVKYYNFLFKVFKVRIFKKVFEQILKIF